MSMWSPSRFYAVDPLCRDEIAVPGVGENSIVTVVAEGELHKARVCYVTMLSTVHDGGVRFDVLLGEHGRRRYFENDCGLTWIHDHHAAEDPDGAALLAAYKLQT